MLVSKQEFPEDEFDALAEEGPSGAHRRPVKRWQTLLPILVVLVLGPALAWGGVALMKGTGHTQTSVATKTTTTTAKATPTGSSQKNTKTQKSTTPKSTESPDDKVLAEEKANARVWVLNASNRTGWAKEIADKLEEDGFSNPVANNTQASGISGSIVLYRGSQFEAVAKEAAKVAGISDVRDADSGGFQIGDTDIAIYLLN